MRGSVTPRPWCSSSLSSSEVSSRLRAVLSYDGTEFAGYQLQPGRRTVQGLLQDGLQRVTGEPVTVTGAGRTDAGVHAAGQVVHFDSPWFNNSAVLLRAWNAVLPRDLVIRGLEPAPPGFHARFSAASRTYTYTLLCRELRDPLLRRYSLHVAKPLDRVAMREAAQCLVGTHDFGAFGRPMKPGGSTVRHISVCVLEEEGDLFRLTVVGNAFLRHQVRRMVGVLIDVGRGQSSPADVAEAVAGRAGAVRPRRVPPQGLVLVAVGYPADEEIAAATRRHASTGDEYDEQDLYAEDR